MRDFDLDVGARLTELRGLADLPLTDRELAGEVRVRTGDMLAVHVRGSQLDDLSLAKVMSLHAVAGQLLIEATRRYAPAPGRWPRDVPRAGIEPATPGSGNRRSVR